MKVLKDLFVVAVALVLAVSVQGLDDAAPVPALMATAGHNKPTTTPAPKTTTPPPTTTTASPPPPSTTTIPTTTAPASTTTPLPPADKGKWAFSDPKTGATCVIVQMAIQMNVTYLSNDSKPLFAVFDLPVNATKTISGSCGNESQFIELQWPSVGNLTNNLTLNFMKNTTTDKFALSSIEADIVQDSVYFPKSGSENKTINLVNSHESFTTPLAMSYRCAKTQTIIFESKGMPNSTLEISSTQIQAFHTDKGNTFGNANDCDYVDVPDIVPIAVGCALGGLVVIVLIVYLVGRHRNQARGYLSM